MSGFNAEEVIFRMLEPRCDEDLNNLEAMEREAFSTPWTSEQYRALMVNGVCRVFGAFAPEGRPHDLIAYVAVAPHKYTTGGELEIYNIAVRPARQGRGLGRLILGMVLAAASKGGFDRAVLEVRSGNGAAIKLYEGLGFTRCGTRSGYYTKSGEDAFVYELPLTGWKPAPEAA